MTPGVGSRLRTRDGIMVMGLLGLRDLGRLTLCLAIVRAILLMAASPSSIQIGSIRRPGTRPP